MWFICGLKLSKLNNVFGWCLKWFLLVLFRCCWKVDFWKWIKRWRRFLVIYVMSWNWSILLMWFIKKMLMWVNMWWGVFRVMILIIFVWKNVINIRMERLFGWIWLLFCIGIVWVSWSIWLVLLRIFFSVNNLKWICWNWKWNLKWLLIMWKVWCGWWF